MPKVESVRLHITMSVETYDRLVQYIIEKHGREARATSITIEEAVRNLLDGKESKTPVSA